MRDDVYAAVAGIGSGKPVTARSATGEGVEGPTMLPQSAPLNGIGELNGGKLNVVSCDEWSSTPSMLM